MAMPIASTQPLTAREARKFLRSLNEGLKKPKEIMPVVRRMNKIPHDDRQTDRGQLRDMEEKMKIDEFVRVAKIATEHDFLTGANYIKQAIRIIEAQREVLIVIRDGDAVESNGYSERVARAALDKEV